MSDGTRRRYALVGTGARAQLFIRTLTTEFADRAELVALADGNPVRIDAHRRLLVEQGASEPESWQLATGAELAQRLAASEIDTVIVTTVDSTHDDFIVAALESGCDAITEKPMTTDVDKCQRILDAVDRTGHQVTVTFNYRYNPLHVRVRELLADGAIGQVGSVHFEWLLDVRHGADYFRRWHRDRSKSGGLLVHKASHHFDLVNWWLGATPAEVYAHGRLFFYGENGARHGYDRGYDRVHGSPEAEGDPFALRMADHPALRELYLDAEHVDGYHRDQNVFAPGVTIDDDLAVLVRYDTGASMTYHLTAYSPWEGYRVAFNGSAGRLELDVVENDHVSRAGAGGVKGGPGSGGAQLHGTDVAVERGHYALTLRRFWEPPESIDVPGYTRSGHGGADVRMTRVLFGGDASVPDELGRAATERDGATALLVGLAANESMRSGAPVRVADLLKV